jgi:hypothetical protein
MARRSSSPPRPDYDLPVVWMGWTLSAMPRSAGVDGIGAIARQTSVTREDGYRRQQG